MNNFVKYQINPAYPQSKITTTQPPLTPNHRPQPLLMKLPKVDLSEQKMNFIKIGSLRSYIMQIQFPRGNIYQIICQENNQALKIQTNNPHEYHRARVIAAAPNAHDMGQLFMIEKVGVAEDEFEIVNCQSNFVWDEEAGQIRLRFGKRNAEQLFKVEKINNNGFWFKTSLKGDKAVALEGILRYKAFDSNAANQIFYIVPVNYSNPLNDTCVIYNNHSGKAIDIPQGTFEHGVQLIQYEPNKRFNQRWRWAKIGNSYLLQNVLNGQCIDIAQQKKSSGSKVIRWEKTGGTNQLWKPVPCGNGIWKIESIHAPGQYLCIQGNSIQDSGKLQINSGNAASLLWKIQGFVPQ